MQVTWLMSKMLNHIEDDDKSEEKEIQLDFREKGDFFSPVEQIGC